MVAAAAIPPLLSRLDKKRTACGNESELVCVSYLAVSFVVDPFALVHAPPFPTESSL